MQDNVCATRVAWKGESTGAMEMKKKREINACNALITILERVAGVKYERERCPDEEASKEKEPDFILKSTCVGMKRMAVEHTVIPLFKGQHDYVIGFYDRAGEINRLCQGKIPADRYYYIMAPHALINSLKDKETQKAFDEELAPWITQQAPQLRIDESAQCSYECYKITLTCGGTHPLWNGRVGRMPENPTNVTRLQKEAFDSAIRHGLDKLRKYKCNPSESFETVLLLEDVAGLQRQPITKGLTSSEKAQIDEYIDYIVVLESREDQMIFGYVWKENETWHGFIPASRRFSLRSDG
jgi:hypothetical protein